MPVVRVHDVGMPAEGGHDEIERGAAEERKPVGVVVVAVDAIASEKIALGDEVDGNVRPRQLGVQDASREQRAVDRHLQRGRMRRDGPSPVGRGVLDEAVRRHHDAHVVAEARQRFGQRTGHVGKPAGLGERRDFRGDEQDLQSW